MLCLRTREGGVQERKCLQVESAWGRIHLLLLHALMLQSIINVERKQIPCGIEKRKKRIVASSHPALGHQLIYYCGCFVVQQKALSSIVFPRWIRQVAWRNKPSVGEWSLRVSYDVCSKYSPIALQLLFLRVYSLYRM